jgi:predicted nucleotidyltransferase
MERPELEAVLRETFRTQGSGVAFAYLFGSRARGDARADSDVDVGVVLAAGRPRTLDALPADLLAELERRLGLPVDLVVLDGAPPDLLHRVLRDGVVVHEADHEARVAFEVQARNEYFDLLPMLTRYRASLLERA